MRQLMITAQGPKVAEVTTRQLIEHHAIAALDSANREAERGMTIDTYRVAFTDLRAAMARIVELIQYDNRSTISSESDS